MHPLLKKFLSQLTGGMTTEEEINIPPTRKKSLNPFVSLGITAAIMLVYFFFALPALNPMSGEFYSFFIIALVIFNALHLLFGKGGKQKLGSISVILLIIALLLPVLLSFFSGPFFHAKRYSQLIHVENGVFEQDVSTISLQQIPIVDRDAAQVIGEKQLGTLTELVSQFVIDPNYPQVNIAGKPVRISPLQYFDLIKYIGNFRNGIQYYVSVDMSTQVGKLNKLEKPIFYSSSDYLFRNIARHLRFQFPFSILGETNFELDDDGNPFYVTSILTKRIGFFGGLDAKGVIITDASSGKSTRYSLDETPTWVDRVHPAELIIDQLDKRGMYNGGFINSIFGQKNVTRTTSGYNYISIGEDIYLTTGVTSVRSDESNLGFYFVNLRTKETKFYQVPSAIEKEAMRSAQGKVQEKEYNPTFPVVLNLFNRPVYFITLKDQANTAKMFAIVDAQQFNNVIVGESVQEAVSKYALVHSGAGRITDASLGEEITPKDIQQVVIDGNTIYFIAIKENDLIFTASAKQLGVDIMKIKVGEKIRVIGNQTENQFDIIQIEQ